MERGTRPPVHVIEASGGEVGPPVYTQPPIRPASGEIESGRCLKSPRVADKKILVEQGPECAHAAANIATPMGRPIAKVLGNQAGGRYRSQSG